MDTEIAELESFIDSYVGEDENRHISSETFTNSSVEQNGYGFYDKEFEEELKERQKQQDSMISALASQHDASSGVLSPYTIPGDFFGDSIGYPSSGYFGAEATFAPFYHGNHLNPTMSDSSSSVFPSYPDTPDMAGLCIGDNPVLPNAGSQNNIPNNDLRHRLNFRKNGMAQKDVMTRTRVGQQHNRNTKMSISVSKTNNESTAGKMIEASLSPLNGRDQSHHSKKTHSPKSRHSSQSSSSESNHSAKNSVVSDRSKSEVKSWLHQNPVTDRRTVKHRSKNKLPKKGDLSQLIHSAQSFIKSEEKMKDVAEMICTKAMKNPASAQSGAILCNEMSHRMVKGTSFRTVLLNIVQNHFKNRHQLIAKAVDGTDNDWCGYFSFLSELYLNLRTSSNERLKILVNPVFDCFHLILEQKFIDNTLSRNFYDNLRIVGLSLNTANPGRMSNLMSAVRDKCIISNDLSVEARRNLLQSVEFYAQGCKIHALNESYYSKFIKNSVAK